MEFTTWHAIANIFNFLLFVIVVAKFAGPMIAKTLEDSSAAVWLSIRSAEDSRSTAEAGLAETRARLSNVDGELAAMLTEARELAAKQAARLEAVGREEAERLRASARDEIERERQAAVQDLRRALMAQAFERAAREMRGAVSADRQRGLVSNLIQKVGDGSLALK